MTDIRSKLIDAGIKNMREFGYSQVTPENILTDEVYSIFFLSMLKENIGYGFDDHINKLIAEIKQ